MKKTNKREVHEDIDEVLYILTYINTLKDMQIFISDLVTPHELDRLAMRWKAARMLAAGIAYPKITIATGMSTATIARLSKILSKHDSGFRLMINGMQK